MIWPAQPIAVEVLSGGLTNANFKVSFASESFALRVQSANTGVLAIDRTAEIAAARLAADAGISPEVVAWLPERNVLVTRFIERMTPSRPSMRAPEMIDQIGDCFRRLHASRDVIPLAFDPFSSCRQYGEVVRAAGVDGGAAQAEAERAASRIEAAVDFHCTVPSHCDAAWLNFLYEEPGRLWLMDWEYAGMSDWKQDLADVSGYHDFDITDDRRLLEAYQGSAPDPELSSLRVLRLMIMFRSALWGLVQQAHGELDEDYGSWTDEWLTRTAEYASSAEFIDHLALLEAETRLR
jgi:thiamine kinase-like enzyme